MFQVRAITSTNAGFFEVLFRYKTFRNQIKTEPILGEVEIVEPITFKEGEIRLMFTMEHSSFFVGQVCLNGKSENAFVPDSFWYV